MTGRVPHCFANVLGTSPDNPSLGYHDKGLFLSLFNIIVDPTEIVCRRWESVGEGEEDEYDRLQIAFMTARICASASGVIGNALRPYSEISEPRDILL
jgi:hypothetical protein